jgi:hypothetical protein
MRAGEMGLSTSEVGDLVAEAAGTRTRAGQAAS